MDYQASYEVDAEAPVWQTVGEVICLVVAAMGIAQATMMFARRNNFFGNNSVQKEGSANENVNPEDVDIDEGVNIAEAIESVQADISEIVTGVKTPFQKAFAEQTEDPAITTSAYYDDDDDEITVSITSEESTITPAPLFALRHSRSNELYPTHRNITFTNRGEETTSLRTYESPAFWVRDTPIRSELLRSTCVALIFLFFLAKLFEIKIRRVVHGDIVRATRSATTTPGVVGMPVNSSTGNTPTVTKTTPTTPNGPAQTGDSTTPVTASTDAIAAPVSIEAGKIPAPAPSAIRPVSVVNPGIGQANDTLETVAEASPIATPVVEVVSATTTAKPVDTTASVPSPTSPPASVSTLAPVPATTTINATAITPTKPITPNTNISPTPSPRKSNIPTRPGSIPVRKATTTGSRPNTPKSPPSSTTATEKK